MFDRHAASAFLALAWCVGGACAQPADSGARPTATPTPASTAQDPASPDSDIGDDPTDSANWRARVTVARQRHADWAACVAAKGHHCSEERVPDPMEPLLNDDTLVKGDIVSTPNGLKVFRGQSTVPHSLADFQ